jgi:hypothetical protein
MLEQMAESFAPAWQIQQSADRPPLHDGISNKLHRLALVVFAILKTQRNMPVDTYAPKSIRQIGHDLYHPVTPRLYGTSRVQCLRA